MEAWIAKIRINGIVKSFDFKDMSEWNARKAAHQLVKFTKSKGKSAVYLGMERERKMNKQRIKGEIEPLAIQDNM